MNEDQLREALTRLEELKQGGALQPCYRIGSGNGKFGLRVVYEDGTSHLKAYGFETARDAILFKTFLRSLPQENPPEMISTPFGQFARDGSSGKGLRHDVVRLEEHFEIPTTVPS
jgi:hypothetical protein